MRFLKTLFWVVLAVGVVLFARENWVPVEIKLWSGLIAEVKLPFLLAVMFLAGFVPTYLLYRGRVWTLKRQMGRPERVAVGNQPVAVGAAPVVVGAAPPAAMAEPVPVMAPEPAVAPPPTSATPTTAP